jgi:periplasmic protein TonB
LLSTPEDDRRVLTTEIENQTLRLTAEFMHMKVVNKLAVLISLGALLPLAVSAKMSEPFKPDGSANALKAPVPLAVVTPMISPNYAGTQVRLAFTVDEKGTPIEFSVVSSPDAAVGKVVVDAVKKWRFKPAELNGTPVARKVLLPVRITAGETFASQ